MSNTSIISYRLRATMRGLAVATRKVLSGLAPKPKVPSAPVHTRLHPAFATPDGPYGGDALLVTDDGTMFYVPISLLADVSPVFHNFTDKPPPWSFTRPPGVSEVCHLPDVDSSALALVLSLIINPDEDDGWVDESTIAGNAAFDLFLDCIHVALLYRLPFIGRLWDIIHANKDTFLVCPFLRCFLACATQNDDMVRQYAWRTLPLKLSDIHPQLKEMWKTYMPHAFVEFARFHKQFHGPAVRMIKALRSSAIPGRNIGHFSKMCRRPEDQVLIDEHACRTIVEYEHDWQRARDAAARYLTAYLFTGWVDWEALVWTYARISFVIEESSETKWCGRCQKNLANIFYNIVVKRFGVDLAIVEEARHDRPLFHVFRTKRIVWKDGQADMIL